MNEFIKDNFGIGNSIVIRCASKIIHGTLVSVEEDRISLRLEDGSTCVYNGAVFQYFTITDNGDSQKEINGSSSEREKQNDVNPKIYSPEIPHLGIKTIGYMDLSALENHRKEKKTQKDILKEANLEKTLFEADGEIQTSKPYWTYMFLKDYNHPNERIHLSFNDIIDPEIIKSKVVGSPLRYILEKDAQGYHARLVHRNYNAKQLILEYGSKHNYKDLVEKYLVQHIERLCKAGDTTSAIRIMRDIIRMDDPEDSITKLLINLQIKICDESEDFEYRVSAYRDYINFMPYNYISNSQKCEYWIKIAKIQIEKNESKESIEDSINEAEKCDKNNDELSTLKEIVLAMPSQYRNNYHDLLLDAVNDIIPPSAMLTNDEDAKKMINNSATSHELSKYCFKKGDFYYKKFVDNISKQSLKQLESYADSATSYYFEALRLLVLPDKEILEAMTKYLRMQVAIYNISENRGSMPQGTMNNILISCMKKNDANLKETILRTFVSIGTYSKRIWNTLLNSKDGMQSIYKWFDEENRMHTYDVINKLEYNDTDKSLEPNEFLIETFSLRDKNKKELANINLKNLDLDDVNSITDLIDKVEEKNYLLTSVDKNLLAQISEIISSLYSWSELLSQEKMDTLESSCKKVSDIIRNIDSEPTYWGRTFFLPVLESWQSILSENLKKKQEQTFPRFEVEVDPHILFFGSARKVQVSLENIGEKSADGCIINYTLQSEKNQSRSIDSELIQNDKKIKSKEKHVVSIEIPFSMAAEKTINLKLKACPIYKGRQSTETSYACTLTELSRNLNLSRRKILWNTNDIVRNELFKGRGQLITDLWDHYTDESTMIYPYILYGLTRVGKSSILAALADRIKGQKVVIGGEEFTILPFTWDLSGMARHDDNNIWKAILQNGILRYLIEFKKEKDKDGNPYIIEVPDFKEGYTAMQFDKTVLWMKSHGILPLFLVDEFSYMKELLEKKSIGRSFLHDLRQKSINREACFIYAGTYDIKELIRDPKFGTAGQLVNSIEKHISAIEKGPAEQLISILGDDLLFTKEAINEIHNLSGDIPYFIQMICLNCAHFAEDSQRVSIGKPELDYVVDVLTHKRSNINKRSYVTDINETTFQGNLIDPKQKYEGMVYSCLIKLGTDEYGNYHEVSNKELRRVWEKNNFSDNIQDLNNELSLLYDKGIVVKSEDGPDVIRYKIAIDLFRKWWSVNHKQDILEIKK